jgi:pathogenesis-related protein 1
MQIKSSVMKQMMLVVGLMIVSASAMAQIVGENTGSEITQAVAQEALDFHNKARKDVGTDPLSWSAELASYAQAWANNLASRNCAFEHRSASNSPDKKNYGENIFWGSGSMYNAVDASKSWYNEIEQYVHGTLTNDNWSVAGHYTQMVWQSTTSVGIGVATCQDGAVIVVANYDPPGNYLGQKAY